MKEVVWIFGISASGKETFINRVMQDSHLCKQLGWENKSIAYSKVSVQSVGRGKGDTIIERREEIS